MQGLLLPVALEPWDRLVRRRGGGGRPGRGRGVLLGAVPPAGWRQAEDAHQTLRSLERDGLITRPATPTVPVTVSYELTDLGLSLHQMMRGLKTWAEMHMDDVLANRATYDTRTA